MIREWARRFVALSVPGATKGKGRDIGYALAASPCEGAYSVDACTVTALDAITAFAVPNPNCSSQNQLAFSGLVARQVALPGRSLSLLRTGRLIGRAGLYSGNSRTMQLLALSV